MSSTHDMRGQLDEQDKYLAWLEARSHRHLTSTRARARARGHRLLRAYTRLIIWIAERRSLRIITYTGYLLSMIGCLMLLAYPPTPLFERILTLLLFCWLVAVTSSVWLTRGIITGDNGLKPKEIVC